MLYGNNRKVLKAIRFLCETSETTNSLDIAVYLHNRIQTEDLIGCLNHLSTEEGYINPITEEGSLVYVSLTHKGRHYQQYECAKMRHFLINSIVIPIIVSAITTLVTFWITGIFK